MAGGGARSLVGSRFAMAVSKQTSTLPQALQGMQVSGCSRHSFLDV